MSSKAENRLQQTNQLRLVDADRLPNDREIIKEAVTQ